MDKKSSIIYLMTLVVAVFGLVSCSEDDDSVEEFPDWQSYNESYWESLYSTTEAKIKAGDTSWKIIRNYSYPAGATLAKTDYIIVHVENEGTGSGCPLFTDDVTIDYRARLLPSTSYSAGLVFAQTYTEGEYNPATSSRVTMAVTDMPDGIVTAFQYMHIGDFWRVYVPYALGYGTVDYSGTSFSIPGYSTLIYDITLLGYSHE